MAYTRIRKFVPDPLSDPIQSPLEPPGFSDLGVYGFGASGALGTRVLGFRSLGG